MASKEFLASIVFFWRQNVFWRQKCFWRQDGKKSFWRQGIWVSNDMQLRSDTNKRQSKQDKQADVMDKAKHKAKDDKPSPKILCCLLLLLLVSLSCLELTNFRRRRWVSLSFAERFRWAISKFRWAISKSLSEITQWNLAKNVDTFPIKIVADGKAEQTIYNPEPFKGINRKRNDIFRWVSLSDFEISLSDFEIAQRNRSVKLSEKCRRLPY